LAFAHDVKTRDFGPLLPEHLLPVRQLTMKGQKKLDKPSRQVPSRVKFRWRNVEACSVL
jgi:hypothetical protein